MAHRQLSPDIDSLKLFLPLVALLIASVATRAQSVASPAAGNSVRPLASERSSLPTNAPETPRADVDERLKTLEEDLREQNRRLDEMRAIIAGQQRLIETLMVKATGSDRNIVTPNEMVTASNGTEHTQISSPAAQSPTQDERIKNLEAKVSSFGLRFSGDFRLRYDGIFRRAEPDPPAGFAPLTHQQNSRMRYRLRLNFDADLHPTLSFHGQLASGVLNNPISNDQDFGQMANRHLFTISEAWVDYHPKKHIQLQAGRLPNIFADNSRFLFDDDVRFNGFNERYTWNLERPFGYISSIEARAGQYILSNPNVAIVTSGSPLAQAGAIVGSTGRSANLFHQGVLFNQKYNDRWAGQFGGDVQLYRNPNQIQLASTANGVALLVQNGLGIVLSGPAGGGNATTTPGGAVYTAPGFKIARLTYRLNWAGFKSGNHAYPVTLNIQGARNVGASVPERDAMLAAIQVGRITRKGDMAFLYIFTTKGANALISQFTDDDIGFGGVNIRSHGFRFELGLARKVTFQSILFIQNQLRSSGQYPNFFVPLNAFTPRQYRLQQQLVFNF
jgi:hypothetical protein